MTDHDDLDQLEASTDEIFRRFSEHAFDAVDPLPATRVRQLAEGRRAKRRMGIAAASVGLTLLGGTVFVQLDAHNQVPTTGRSVDVRSSATPSPTPSAASRALSAANMPGTDLFYVNAPGDMTVTGSDAIGSEAERQLQSPLTACEQTLAHGQQQTLVRTYSGAGTGYAAILQFGTTSQAAAARGTYRQYFKDCAKTIVPPSGYTLDVTPATEFPVTGAGVDDADTNASYRLVTLVPASGDEAQFNDVTIITVDNRMVILSLFTTGQDHDCLPDAGTDAPQCSMTAQASAIARLLAQG
ncbi:MAG TPA: hypothetical protein H9987_09440 [Candidatus Luteococcus avicola]|nr:hypothetical protein [Candidatus Luteococcus avicola]